MKKQSIFLSIFLAWVLMSASAFAQLPFLQQSGTLIVEENTGHPVFLKGTNLGNWFVMEGFMSTTSAHIYKTQSDIKRMFKNQGATESAIENFYSDWRHHFIRKADIDYIASKGMNCIRVPLHYELFIPPTIREKRRDVIYASDAQRNAKYETYKTALGNWANDPNFTPDAGLLGFHYINNLINWCKQNDMYIILDMHTVPGTQGTKEPIADRIHDNLPAKDLFHDSRNEDALVAIWKSISDIYKGESTIAMYELINEPNYLTSQEVNDLRGIYKRLIGTIRNNNDDHLILLQGNEFGNNYKGIEPTQFTAGQRENLVYSIHRYNTSEFPLPGNTHSTYHDTSHIAHLGNALIFRDTYQVPIFCGETGLNVDYEWAEDNIKALNKVGIGWTVWTYKHHRDVDRRCMAKIPGKWLSDGPNYFSEYINNIKFANISENPNPEYWAGINAPINTIPTNLIITLKGYEDKYVSGNDGNGPMYCDRASPEHWEKFRVEYVSGNKVRLKALSSSGGYVSSENGSLSGMKADRSSAGAWETFTWVTDEERPNRVSLKGNNDKYVSLREHGTNSGPMVCNRNTAGNWETFIWQITTYPGKPLHQASVDGKQFSKVEMFEQEAIWLSPNPTHDVLNIQINELRQDATAPLFISVINTNGRIMHHQEVALQHDEVQISCKDWPAGVYLVSIEAENNVHKERVIIGK